MKKYIGFITISLAMIFIVSQATADVTVGPIDFSTAVITPTDVYTITGSQVFPGGTLSFELIVEPTPSLLADDPYDNPQMTLRNTSTVSETITSFTIGIGDTAYNYDFMFDIQTLDAGIPLDVPVWMPDFVNNAVRSDTIVGSDISGFNPPDQLIFTVDIDLDSTGFPGTDVDFRNALFGDTPGFVSVTFSDNIIPEPATIALLSIGLVGLIAKKRI